MTSVFGKSKKWSMLYSVHPALHSTSTRAEVTAQMGTTATSRIYSRSLVSSDPRRRKPSSTCVSASNSSSTSTTVCLPSPISSVPDWSGRGVGESRKAFNLLSKRLKPLEHYQPVPYDFYSLCYLTSASTVHDAPTMRDWGGAGPERERLMGMWREIVESRVGADGELTLIDARHKLRSCGGGEGGEGERPHVPPDRLRVLFRQAAAWQVSTAISRGKSPWTVKT
jgi:hypothetical protein